jgi:hypothetical protein
MQSADVRSSARWVDEVSVELQNNDKKKKKKKKKQKKIFFCLFVLFCFGVKQ